MDSKLQRSDALVGEVLDPVKGFPTIEERLEALRQRRANPPEQINNASLYAGSPMYYYCVSCGHLSDVKPENWFMNPPKKLCKECQALKDLGRLE